MDRVEAYSAVTVNRPGEKVWIGTSLGDERIEATIDSVALSESILGYKVDYKVVWWAGRERKESWVTDREVFTKAGTKTVEIGFKT